MTTKELKNYKEIYLNERIDDLIVEKRWNSLYYLLGNQEKNNYSKSLSYGMLFAIIAVLIIFVVTITLNSKPENKFYAIKSLSKTFSAKVAGIFQTKDLKPTGIIKKSANISVTVIPSQTPTQQMKETKPTKVESQNVVATHTAEKVPQNNVSSNNQVQGTTTTGGGQNESHNGNNGNGNSNNNNGNGKDNSNDKKGGQSKH